MEIFYIVSNNRLTYELLYNYLQNVGEIQNVTNHTNTPLIELCDNDCITYEILELFISKLKYKDLIVKNDEEYTPLMELCSNESLTYEMLDLFISKLKYEDLIVRNDNGANALICLCANDSLTFDMLNLFISRLNEEDLYARDFHDLSALQYLTISGIDVYKLFITRSIEKEIYIEDLGVSEYNKYKEEIDNYFIYCDYILK